VRKTVAPISSGFTRFSVVWCAVVVVVVVVVALKLSTSF
jgi:hypothetical protein